MGALTLAASAQRPGPRGALARPQPNQGARQDFRSQGSFRPGDFAPDFTLEPRGGGAPVTLSSYRGKTPVALVFGSYT